MNFEYFENQYEDDDDIIVEFDEDDIIYNIEDSNVETKKK